MRHNRLRQCADLQDELLTRKAARSLRAFVEQAWPVLEPTTPFLPNWHIDLVCEHLEAITAGETTRLLINLPPRYMKSLLVSVFWPVWEWISSPSRRWICVSYSDALSLKLSLDRRTLVQSEWYQARWGHTVQLSSDQNVKGEFRNTRQGVMCATSVGGSATGKGGDRIIVDDLHNPQQADSDAQREAALRFFRETLSTRLDTPKTWAVVVVMQRLHEADLSARCLELGYRYLCLPVEADAATDIVFPVSGRVVTREPGHLLWPAREGQTELAIQRRQLGSTAFDTQYQQRPAPAGGRLFKRAWFKFYDERPRGSTWLASWDMSFKGGPSNDYVVGLQAAREGADVYLVDRVKGQWDFSRRRVGKSSASTAGIRRLRPPLSKKRRMGPRLSMSSLTRSPASSQSCPMAGSTLVPRRRYRSWRRETSGCQTRNLTVAPSPSARGWTTSCTSSACFRRARTTTTWMPSRNSSRAASGRSRAG